MLIDTVVNNAMFEEGRHSISEGFADIYPNVRVETICLYDLLVNILNRFFKGQSVTFNKEKLKNPNETSWKTYKSFWIDADSAPSSRQRKQRNKVEPGDLICPY